MKSKARMIASLKIWIVIYPALTVFLYAFQSQMSELPLYVRTLLMTAALVPFVVFVGVPTVDRLVGLLSRNSRRDS